MHMINRAMQHSCIAAFEELCARSSPAFDGKLFIRTFHPFAIHFPLSSRCRTNRADFVVIIFVFCFLISQWYILHFGHSVCWLCFVHHRINGRISHLIVCRSAYCSELIKFIDFVDTFLACFRGFVTPSDLEMISTRNRISLRVILRNSIWRWLPKFQRIGIFFLSNRHVCRNCWKCPPNKSHRNSTSGTAESHSNINSPSNWISLRKEPINLYVWREFVESNKWPPHAAFRWIMESNSTVGNNDHLTYQNLSSLCNHTSISIILLMICIALEALSEKPSKISVHIVEVTTKLMVKLYQFQSISFYCIMYFQWTRLIVEFILILNITVFRFIVFRIVPMFHK